MNKAHQGASSKIYEDITAQASYSALEAAEKGAAVVLLVGRVAGCRAPITHLLCNHIVATKINSIISIQTRIITAATSATKT
jgi:hypothetical protein